MLILLFGFLWALSNGSVQILSINQDISCHKFLSKQNFEVALHNKTWLPQFKLIKVFGVNLKSDPKISYSIQDPNFASKILNTLQTFGYLDEKQAYLVPVLLSGNQKTKLNIYQEHAIQKSVLLPVITLYSNPVKDIKRTIKLKLDKSYKDPTSTPILNENDIFNSTYNDNNLFTIKVKWEYTQYFNVSNFMG
ncbi:MAG: hypothetical protein KC646_06385 [Candidatus Cloacimonetes bacterium]|nr:hypothetical protein [Candidatus Cloacimonadota bacterium]